MKFCKFWCRLRSIGEWKRIRVEKKNRRKGKQNVNICEYCSVRSRRMEEWNRKIEGRGSRMRISLSAG
jgi:hypothetical protein